MNRSRPAAVLSLLLGLLLVIAVASRKFSRDPKGELPYTEQPTPSADVSPEATAIINSREAVVPENKASASEPTTAELQLPAKESRSNEDLKSELILVSKEFSALRRQATKAEFEAGRVFMSSTDDADAMLASPGDTDDLIYVRVKNAAGHHLVELHRSDHPAFFAVSDKLRELEEQVAAAK